MDYSKVSLIALLALLLLPGAFAQNITNTTVTTNTTMTDDLVDGAREAASSFKSTFQEYVSYDLLFGLFCAAIIYATFAKGSVGAQSGMVKIAFIIAVLFILCYFFL